MSGVECGGYKAEDAFCVRIAVGINGDADLYTFRRGEYAGSDLANDVLCSTVCVCLLYAGRNTGDARHETRRWS